jgi:hypothetical protein
MSRWFCTARITYLCAVDVNGERYLHLGRESCVHVLK